ncbi:ankyrin repeat, SAM and basic leucine zipper domain-containing protein 1 isoform X2 [Corythoichthys intestinalis]|uniref:ankyrin repeat, SAM and basic leucine zipper domain-containing protein 1 isoform X2 n=1 Tax=Corythoichthys intestinalis TaxID=161448 RepID=UPI0025A53141|nr:ankyrin repeat, SAM and basic leucine zipper domain-containing protein 1 isoform X2 [Corythoichthys intestinalis]
MDVLQSVGIPAGYESDSSTEDWYTEHPPVQKSFHLQNSGYADEEVDKVSLMKNAIHDGNVDAVEQLLDNGMDVDTMLGFDWTPLMSAVTLADNKVAKVLLDHGANANSSKDCKTVLMIACTAQAKEDKIARCVELLLSRNANPNKADKSQVTCLMLAARDNHCKVINLLVSYGADLNMQEANGYTALALAVHRGRQQAVLKLLQLGADKSIVTGEGKSPAQLATLWKYPQISRILSSSMSIDPILPFSSSGECLSTVSKTNTQFPSFAESMPKLNEMELLLHGLDLEYLTDIINEKDITWSELLTMEKEDLVKLGITDAEDQQKVLSALRQIHMDRVDLDTIEQLGVTDSGSEELLNFLSKLKQQCCCLTETIQDTISRFPLQVSKLVFKLDHKREAQTMCSELIAQTKDLQTEVNCLHNLLCQMNDAPNCCELPVVRGNRKLPLLPSVAIFALGISAFALGTAFFCRQH